MNADMLLEKKIPESQNYGVSWAGGEFKADEKRALPYTAGSCGNLLLWEVSEAHSVSRFKSTHIKFGQVCKEFLKGLDWDSPSNIPNPTVTDAGEVWEDGPQDVARLMCISQTSSSDWCWQTESGSSGCDPAGCLLCPKTCMSLTQ